MDSKRINRIIHADTTVAYEGKKSITVAVYHTRKKRGELADIFSLDDKNAEKILKLLDNQLVHIEEAEPGVINYDEDTQRAALVLDHYLEPDANAKNLGRNLDIHKTLDPLYEFQLMNQIDGESFKQNMGTSRRLIIALLGVLGFAAIGASIYSAQATDSVPADMDKDQ